jgi:hypothetical protein
VTFLCLLNFWEEREQVVGYERSDGQVFPLQTPGLRECRSQKETVEIFRRLPDTSPFGRGVAGATAGENLPFTRIHILAALTGKARCLVGRAGELHESAQLEIRV